MTLDLFSVTVMTAIVALTAAGIFVVETLRRREEELSGALLAAAAEISRRMGHTT